MEDVRIGIYEITWSVTDSGGELKRVNNIEMPEKQYFELGNRPEKIKEYILSHGLGCEPIFTPNIWHHGYKSLRKENIRNDVKVEKPVNYATSFNKGVTMGAKVVSSIGNLTDRIDAAHLERKAEKLEEERIQKAIIAKVTPQIKSIIASDMAKAKEKVKEIHNLPLPVESNWFDVYYEATMGYVDSQSNDLKVFMKSKDWNLLDSDERSVVEENLKMDEPAKMIQDAWCDYIDKIKPHIRKNFSNSSIYKVLNQCEINHKNEVHTSVNSVRYWIISFILNIAITLGTLMLLENVLGEFVVFLIGIAEFVLLYSLFKRVRKSISAKFAKPTSQVKSDEIKENKKIKKILKEYGDYLTI